MENKTKLIQHDKALSMIRAMGVPETRSKWLSSSLEVLLNRLSEEIYFLKKENKKLTSMIDNNLHWEDLKNDVEKYNNA